jgi:hypothetical protein
MTFTQAVGNLNKQHNVQEIVGVKQTLQHILGKLNKQETLFTTFDEHIKKLENSAQLATPKIKQKLIALSTLWRNVLLVTRNS